LAVILMVALLLPPLSMQLWLAAPVAPAVCCIALAWAAHGGKSDAAAPAVRSVQA